MTDFVTSDHHFRHKNIISLAGRPFNSLEQMEEALIAGWNTEVRPNDTVYHVGDLSFDLDFLTILRQRLRGNIKLIPGNHDAYHPMHKRSERAKAFAESLGFEVLDGKDLTLTLGGMAYSVCHFPPVSVEDPPYNARYPQWRPVSTEHPRICGHVHEKWRQRRINNQPVFNVSVEMWHYRPVSVDILRYMLTSWW